MYTASWLLLAAMALLIGVPSFLAGWVASGMAELRDRLRKKV